MPLPPLRNVDVSSIPHEGQSYVCLRDPEGFIDDQLFLTPHAFFIAAHLDGANGLAEVQAAFQRQFGLDLPADEVHKIVSYLDESGFLVTDRYHAIRDRVLRTFAESDVRPAYMAGRSYPDDPEELRDYLNELFVCPDGPGKAPGPAPGSGPVPRAIVSPHIDLERGGHCYAHTYLRLYTAGRPDTVFIFGVSHAGGAGPFILTRKHYETPLGTLETDQEIVDQLESVATWDPYEDEIVHRSEHSIEFQVLMLAHLFGTDVRVVPILCSQFSEDPTADNPESNPQVAQFLDTCRAAVQARPNTTVIAAADLAHVGPRFGDPFQITKPVIRRVTEEDHRDLAHVVRVDPAGFYRSVMQDQNARKVCGLNCIYATLRAIDVRGATGTLLQYGQAPDPAGGLVSFAGIVVT